MPTLLELSMNFGNVYCTLLLKNLVLVFTIIYTSVVSSTLLQIVTIQTILLFFLRKLMISIPCLTFWSAYFPKI